MRTLSLFESDGATPGFAQRLSLDRNIELSAELFCNAPFNY
jgi:hypothetical protein